MHVCMFVPYIHGQVSEADDPDTISDAGLAHVENEIEVRAANIVSWTLEVTVCRSPASYNHTSVAA